MFNKIFNRNHPAPEQEKGSQPLPAEPVVPEERQRRIGLWVAAIYAALSMALLVFSFYMVYVVGTGKPDLSDSTLEPVAGLMIICSLVSYFLIRRNRVLQGTWILLSIATIPPIFAVLVLNDIFIVMVLFLAILASIPIVWMFPKKERTKAINASGVALLAMIGIQVWNPAFRLGSSTLPNFTVYIIALTALAIIGFFARQLWIGSLQMRLQTRLTLMVALTAIPVFALGAFVINLNGRSIIQQQSIEKLRLANNSVVGNTSDQLKFSVQILDQLAQMPDIAGMNPGLQIPVLKAVAAADPDYYLVHVMDPTGMDISRSDDLASKDYKDRLYFKIPISGGPATFQTVQGKTTGNPALTVGVAIRDPNGTVIGVVSVASELTKISKSVSDTKLGNTGYAYVVDQNNIVIAHPDPKYSAALTDISTYPPVAMMRHGNPGLVTFTDPQGHAWHAYTSVLDNGWGVIVQQQDADFLQAATTFGNISLAVMAGGILILLFVIWLVMRREIRPITLLTRTAEKIADGDLNQVVVVGGQDELGILANTFNRMTSQLRDLIGSLEQRVADRTQALATVADVETATSTILEKEKLLQAVVDLTKERFNLYHSHIYLLDETGQNLVLAAGAGEPGRQMKAQGFSIPLDREQSLVARAARERKGVTVNDVTQAPDFLPNPLLPATRSELAVPMIVGGNVTGVFDVQSEDVGRFTDADISVQTTLAAQIATSIQNVRQYEEAQRTTEQLSEALDIAKLANWEYDVENDLFHFNDHFYAIFHTTAEKMGGYQISSAQYAKYLVHPDDVPMVGGEIGKALASTDRHYNSQLEHRIIFSDGSTGYISVVVHIERDEKGRIVRYYGANQDITERKLAEVALDQRATKAKILNDITQKIQSATSVDAALQVTVRELGHALGMKPTRVILEQAAPAHEDKTQKESAS